MKKNPNMPKNWELNTLIDTAEIILGQSPSSDTYNTDSNGLPFYQGKAEFGELYPVPVKWCTAPKKIAQNGDILISVRAPVGPTNICQEKSCIGRGLAAIRAKENVVNKYILYYLRSIENEWNKKATGTTFKAITGNVLRNQEIPIPSYNEQKLIVAKIEELFSQLDAGVAGLKRAQAELQLYRASVLKAAFEGRLVPQDANDEMVIIASKKTEKDLIKDSGFRNIPNNWSIARLDQVCEKIQDGTHFSPKNQYDQPHQNRFMYITAKNIKEDGIDLSNITYVDFETHNEFTKRCDPKQGDVLLIKDGVKTGISTVNELVEEFSLLSSVALIRPRKGIVNPYFLKHYLNSPIGKRNTIGKMTGTAIKRIILKQIRNSFILIPPINEQNKIVSFLEQRISVVEQLEKEIGSSLHRSIVLKNKILDSAFAGKLMY